MNIKPNAIIRNKNFMLLITGKIVSLLGSSINQVAVVWFLIEFFGGDSSGKFIALYFTCVLVTRLIVGPLAGVYADRWNRKRIIFGTDYIRGIIFGVMAILVYIDFYTIPSIFILTIFSVIAGSFFEPAVSASIPNIVTEDNLLKANSINGMSGAITGVLGAAIAGFLYYWIGIAGVFLFNGISYILSGVSEMFIHMENNNSHKNQKNQFFIQLKEGFKYMLADKVVLSIIAVAVLLNFVFGPVFQIVMPQAISFDLQLDARFYGIVGSVMSIGGVIGMLLMSLIKKKQKYFAFIAKSLILETIFFGFIGVVLLPTLLGSFSSETLFIGICVSTILIMIFNSLVNVPIMTIFQTRVSDEYRGRFFGMLQTLTMAISPLGMILVGAVSGIFSSSELFIAGAIFNLLIVLGMMFNKHLKEI